MDQETIQSEIQVIKSKGLAERVVKKLGLFRLEEFNTRLRKPTQWQILKTSLHPKSWLPESWVAAMSKGAASISEEEKAILEQSAIVGAYNSKLKIERIDRSRVIKIIFTSKEPALAQRAANTLADLYIVEQLEAKFEATKNATTWLNDRLGNLRKQVEVSERAVEQFRNTSGLTQGRGGVKLVSQQVSEISTQLVLARSKRAEAEARLDQVRTLLKQHEGINSAAEVLASPLIQSLRGQEAEVLRKAAELSEEYGRKHPRMINIRNEIQNIRAKIKAEVGRIVLGLSNEVSVAKSRERSFENSIRRLEQRVGTLNRSEVRLRALEREAKANRTLYENFLSRFKELSGQGGIQQADARVVSYGDLPGSPSFPKPFLLLGLAFVGSVFAGLGAAGVLERLDHGFRSMDQVERQTGVPAISLIPTLPKGIEVPADYVLNSPHSAYAESLRSLFASLHLSNVDDPPKVILMTSSVPEEGKSLTSISLARLIAQTGKKVILVDGDLRRPQVHNILDMELTPGIVEVLAGESTIDEALRKDSESGAFILVAGSKPSNPVDLMSSQHFKDLIANLREAADMVIIDSAPLTAVSDARILARIADKTVFVIRWASTRREVVTMALRQMVDAGADFAGAILSRVDVRRHAQYGYADSGYYYGRSRKYYTDD